MKKMLVVCCIALGAVMSGWAAERVWVGASGAQWSVAQNWQGGQVPLSGDVAVFNGFEGTVTVDVSTPPLAGVQVTSGAFELVPSDSGIRLNGATDCVFDIGEGAVLTNSVYSVFPAGAAVVKSGVGALVLNRNFNTSGTGTLDITEGSVRLLLGVGGDGLNVGRGSIIIRDSATLYETTNNLINNEAVIDVREGGLFDGTGCGGDAIGAIIGNGTLTNVAARLTLPDWLTYQFDGVIFSTALTLGNTPATQYNTGYYRIANPTNHAAVSMTLSDTNIVTFAAGIGEARVRRVLGINQTPRISLTLEDEAGAPVQLVLGDANAYTDTINLLLEGSGGLGMTNTTQTVNTELPYYGPTVLNAGAWFFLGDGTAEGSISNSEYLCINGGATFAPRPLSAWLWDKPTFGNGTFQLTREGATAELSSLFMTNGTVNIGANNSTNYVTLSGGQATGNIVNIYQFSELAITGGYWENNEFWRYNTGAVFTVSGGAVSGGVYRTRDGGSLTMLLSGGSSTNVDLYLNNDGALEVTGGSHFFRSTLTGNSRNARYYQSGGTTGFVRSDAHNNTNETFIFMTGGTMYNIGDGSGNFRGMGATLSNDARFIQQDRINVRVASDGMSHTIRLLDQSYMEVQHLQMMSSGLTGSCGRVILQDNATLALRGNITTECNPTNTAHLHFNGGTFRLLPSNGWTFNHSDHAWYWIEEGGLNLELQSPTTSPTLNLNAPLRDGTGTGNDGGLNKSGLGRLVFNADQFYTGPTLLRDGNTILNRTVQTFYGGNEIRLQGSILEISPSGSGTLEIAPLGASGTLAYDYGFASVVMNRGSYNPLTLTFPSFTRVGNGTLLLYSLGNSMANVFGTTDNFKLSAPPPQLNGILCPSVAAFQNAESPRVVDFLRHDTSDSILRRANYGAVTDGPTAVAQVTVPQTLNDTHVYALKLNATTLTLNSGQTLTVGDGINPAGLILNCAPAGRATITGGTLDFGNSEGLIWNSDRRGVNEGAIIASTITGTKGVTLRGITINSQCDFTAANTYSGGTRIQSGTLSVNGDDRLGSDDVWVYGSKVETGGSLRIAAAATIPNNLHLLGLGHGNSVGALRFENNATVTGTVEVSDQTRIAVGNGTFTANLTGGVYGAGRLEVMAAAGRLRLTAPSTHTGGTLITSGILEIAEGSTLGSGSVSNNATLAFVNTSDIVVPNDIWGSGQILLSGTGKVTFTGKTTCTLVSATSSTLGDGAYTFGSLGGTGTLYSANAQLTVGETGMDTYFAGTLTGGISVEKTGPGTLTLAGQNQNTGDLLITGGTVRLGGLPSVPTNGLVYQLDAQNDATVIRDGSGIVSDWLDATPNGLNFTEALPINRPLYRADGINGLPSVYFGGWTNRLTTQTSASVQQVFIVNQPESANMKSLGGIWGRSGSDAGLRVQGSVWQIGGSFNENGLTYVNGIPQNTFIMDTPHLVSTSSGNVQNWVTAIGDYWGNPNVNNMGPRSYAGDIGELLAYGTTVSDAARIMLEMYLSHKWQMGLYPLPATSGILSPDSGLVIGTSGVLDLNGSVECVTRLDGAGVIINSAAAQATLTVGSGDFSGTIDSGITLAVDGGTLILRNDRMLDALELRNDATLDLAGATLRVKRISGRGSIISGTVIVSETLAPDGLLELPATDATGCTLEIALRTVSCGNLHIDGDFDLSTLHLDVTVAEPLRELDYTLLACSGQLTGTAFATATLPPRANLRYAPQAVSLFYLNGTRLILR